MQNCVQSSLLQAQIEKNNAQKAASLNTNSPIQAGNSAVQNTSPINPTTQNLQSNLNQDTVDLNTENKKERQKEIAKLLLGGVSLLTVVCMSALAIKHKSEIGEFINKTYKNLKTSTQDVRRSAEDATHSVQSQTVGRQTGMDNFVNTKDTLTRKLLLRFRPYRKYDEVTTGVYKKTVLGVITSKWGKTAKLMQSSDKKIMDALVESDLDDNLIKRAGELLRKRSDAVSQMADPNNIAARFRQLDDSLSHLEEDGYQTIQKAAKVSVKNLFERLKESNIGQNRLNEARKVQEGLIGQYRYAGLTLKEVAELENIVGKVLKNNPELQKESAKATTAFMNTYAKEATDLFSKLRDINFGSAPTDVTTMLIAGTGLGVYTAQADTKEEKVGVTLTTGIPLLTTLGTTMVATTNMISGSRALLLGIGTGQIAKLIGKITNKKYQKEHKTEDAPRTIITLDDYKSKVEEAFRNAGIQQKISQ